MAKKKANKKQSSKKNNKNNATSSGGDNGGGGGGMMVDPARVRFQHARIRPVFSGCGRSVTDTLDQIREQKIKPSDLPPIQVIVGPETEDGPNYFSLNNRRLWVLKRCREEGLLPNNQIYVRVRKPKSDQEAARYSIQNCALEAKIMPEKSRPNKNDTTKPNQENTNDIDNNVDDTTASVVREGMENMKISDKPIENSTEETNDSEDSESSDEPIGFSNRFSLPVHDDSSDEDSESSEEAVGVSNRFSALL